MQIDISLNDLADNNELKQLILDSIPSIKEDLKTVSVFITIMPSSVPISIDNDRVLTITGDEDEVNEFIHKLKSIVLDRD